MVDFVKRSAAVFAGAGLAVAVAASASAQTTIFGSLPGPTPSAADPGLLASDVGLFPSDDVLGDLANFTNFQVQNLGVDLLGGGTNDGEIIFLQNGNFYVGGAGPASANPLSEVGEANLGGPQVNNRAYGVFGTGRSDITFTPGAVTELILQLRGTEEGLSVGPDAALGQTLPENSPLGDADATLLVYSELGLELELTVANADFQTFSIDVSGFELLGGDSITRIGLVNEGGGNSAIVLGELTVVPEPASLVFLASGGLMMLKRRKA